MKQWTQKPLRPRKHPGPDCCEGWLWEVIPLEKWSPRKEAHKNGREESEGSVGSVESLWEVCRENLKGVSLTCAPARMWILINQTLAH